MAQLEVLCQTKTWGKHPACHVIGRGKNASWKLTPRRGQAANHRALAIQKETMSDPKTDRAEAARRKAARTGVTKFWLMLAALALSLLLLARNAWQQQQKLLRPGDIGGNSAPKQFDLSNISIDPTEIHEGGPPKDGIPALTSPEFLDAGDTFYLRPNDRVIGFVSPTEQGAAEQEATEPGATEQGDADGRYEARAYPLKILDLHEVVNDRINGLPIAVTYCPLCDSCSIFDRRTKIGEREFGVSGLLYNSNVLIYDRGKEKENLWSQVLAQGVSGNAKEVALKALPVELTTWGDWSARYPRTKVLSPKTGHGLEYDGSAYAGYFASPDLVFPTTPRSERLPTKERVLGVWIGDQSRAYAESIFSSDRKRIEDELGGKRVVIEFNSDSRSMRVVESDDDLQWMYSLWFAWYAMRPDTTVAEMREVQNE